MKVIISSLNSIFRLAVPFPSHQKPLASGHQMLQRLSAGASEVSKSSSNACECPATWAAVLETERRLSAC